MTLRRRTVLIGVMLAASLAAAPGRADELGLGQGLRPGQEFSVPTQRRLGAERSRAQEPTQEQLLERDIEHKLDILESQRQAPPSPRPSELFTRSQLKSSEQELRTLKTLDPHAKSIPLLEQQLDSIQRGRAPRNPLLRNN